MNYFFPELLTKLEFERVPVYSVPDLPASNVFMHFPCPWCWNPSNMRHRIILNGTLASKEETDIIIPTQSHVTNLHFAKFLYISTSHLYIFIWHAHIKIRVRFKVGFGLDPHVFLWITLYKNHMKLQLWKTMFSCEIGLDFTHIRVVSFRIEDLAPFSVILSY